MGKKNSSSIWNGISEQMKRNKKTFIVYTVLRALVILSLVRAIMLGQWENVFTCALALILFLLPVLIERRLSIELPSTLEIIILLFIYSAEILGEMREFYVRVPHWDTMMHTLNGFLCAAVGFALLDILNRNSAIKFELSPLYLAIVAFCFSMTIGVLWEFFEFSMDKFFLRDMQKDTVLHTISSVMLDPQGRNVPYIIKDITEVTVNGTDLGLGGYLDIGLYDTMKDLFVNFIGAVVFSLIGYFYVKNRGKGAFAKKFIPTLPPEEDQAPEAVDPLTDSLE